MQLIEQWRMFGEKMKTQGELNAASIINVDKPILDTAGNVIFKLPTKLMEEQFGNIKPNLLGFLRSSLKNYGFEIKTQVVASAKKTRAYLPKDKFEKLAKENPDLLLLKSKFGLDI